MSRFLPENFDASKPLALIAGQGQYPILLAQRARTAGIHLRLIELGGETPTELVNEFKPEQRATVKRSGFASVMKY